MGRVLGLALSRLPPFLVGLGERERRRREFGVKMRSVGVFVCPVALLSKAAACGNIWDFRLGGAIPAARVPPFASPSVPWNFFSVSLRVIFFWGSPVGSSAASGTLCSSSLEKKKKKRGDFLHRNSECWERPLPTQTIPSFSDLIFGIYRRCLGSAPHPGAPGEHLPRLRSPRTAKIFREIKMPTCSGALCRPAGEREREKHKSEERRAQSGAESPGRALGRPQGGIRDLREFR